MQDQSVEPLGEFAQRFSDYLPTLAYGLFIFILGIAVGWVVKRAVVRILIWLRLDRLGGRVGWRAAFGKGDVRAALYNLLGSIAMFLVVLVFLDDALKILGLTVLSRMIETLAFFLPNLGLVGLIVGVGVMLSNMVASRMQDTLELEEFAHARLVGTLLKGVLLFVVGALALWQLNLARDLVLAGFLIAFGAMGLAFAMAVGLGTRKAIQRGWESLFDRRKKGE